MLFLQERIIWTDPLPPPSEYVNILGTKLKAMFRAPSGVSGSPATASAWTDSVTGTRVTRSSGTATLAPVSNLFSGKPVLNHVSASTWDGTFANPLVLSGDSPEMFVVFRANTLAVSFGTLIALLNFAGTFTFEIATGVDQLKITINGSTTAIAFTDTTAVHFFSGRRDPVTGNRVFHLDGVDTVGTAGALLNSPSNRVRMGGSPSLDGSVALCGLVQAPMSDAERAEVLRIARSEYSF